MTTVRLTLLIVAICGAATLAMSQPPERREAGPPDRREGGPPDGPGAGPQFRVLPPFAQRELQLTPEQQKQIEALEADVQTKMQKILTPEQIKQWSDRRAPRGPRGDQPGADRTNPSRREASDEPRPDRPRGGDPARTGGDRTRTDDEPRRPSSSRRDGQSRGDQSSSPRRSSGPMERVAHQLNLTTEQQAKVDKVLQAHHEKTRALFRQAQADVLMQMKEVLTEEQFQQFTKALENGPPGYRRRDRSSDASRSERAEAKP